LRNGKVHGLMSGITTLSFLRDGDGSFVDTRPKLQARI
jgi:hypothetical protein